MSLRVPGWCDGASLSLNGEAGRTPTEDRGYLRIEREWQPGDSLTLDLPMQVQTLSAHPRVAADVGRVAVLRGPLVYCAEDVDNAEGVAGILLSGGVPDAAITRLPELGGAVALDIAAQRPSTGAGRASSTTAAGRPWRTPPRAWCRSTCGTTAHPATCRYGSRT